MRVLTPHIWTKIAPNSAMRARRALYLGAPSLCMWDLSRVLQIMVDPQIQKEMQQITLASLMIFDNIVLSLFDSQS